MGNLSRIHSIICISIMSVALFTGVLSIPNFSSQSNEIIDDSIQDFTFGLIQLSSATSHVPSYASVTQSFVSPPLIADNTLVYYITTDGNIPQVPDSYISSTLGFGYAWLDSSNPINAVIVMIHQAGVDSENSNVWHTHSTTLSTTTTCSEVGAESELSGLTSVTYVASEIFDNTFTMLIANATVTNESFSSAKSFQLLQSGESLCLGTP